ncbi:hypothetical protein KMA67_04135, partial [Enterococcus durans]|uniref:hypothetical protein n=1 Tax=Enterococcus durans TaxID=53345 RepID=UPI001D0AE56A
SDKLYLSDSICMIFVAFNLLCYYLLLTPKEQEVETNLKLALSRPLVFLITPINDKNEKD